MSQEISGINIKVEGVGSVTKAKPVTEPVREDPTPTPARASEFNDGPARIIDVDSGAVVKDAGKTATRGTGELSNDAVAADMSMTLSDPEDRKGMWELYGFKANYIIPGSKNQLAAGAVKAYFKDVEAAKACISGRSYTHVFADASVLACNIIEGMPRIAYDDSEKLQYVDDKWIRS